MSIEFSKSNYYVYIVKGDLIGALHYIKQFAEQTTLYDKYITIFKHKQYISYPIDDELNSILKIYQQYYRDVFFLNIDKKESTDKLKDRLTNFLRIKEENIELSDVENQIAKVFKYKGYYFMGGKTSGYYGPYVWKSIETKSYKVELPAGNQEYRIDLLDGFITKSWIDYLSFGEISPGGWTNGDGIINCIKSSYDIDSESLKVSLLKHEAQHVRDLSNFKEISSEDLEYRAKLVELIYSKERNLLELFSNEAAPSDKSNGHSLASGKIIEGFIQKLNLSHAELTNLSMIQIQTTAKALFEESEVLLCSRL